MEITTTISCQSVFPFFAFGLGSSCFRTPFDTSDFWAVFLWAVLYFSTQQLANEKPWIFIWRSMYIPTVFLSISTLHSYLFMVPLPKKIWVVGDQIFKVNSTLHAGQGSREVNLELSQTFRDSWQVCPLLEHQLQGWLVHTWAHHHHVDFCPIWLACSWECQAQCL